MTSANQIWAKGFCKLKLHKQTGCVCACLAWGTREKGDKVIRLAVHRILYASRMTQMVTGECNRSTLLPFLSLFLLHGHILYLPFIKESDSGIRDSSYITLDIFSMEYDWVEWCLITATHEWLNVYNMYVYFYVQTCVYGGCKTLLLGSVCFLIAYHLIWCVMVTHLYPQTIHVADQFALGFLAGCHTCPTDSKHEHNTYTISTVNFLFVCLICNKCIWENKSIFCYENLIDAKVMLELMQLVTLHHYHFFMLSNLCSISRCQITNFVLQPSGAFIWIHT